MLVLAQGLPSGILGLAYPPLAQPLSSPLMPFFDQLVTNHGADDVFTMVLCGIRGGSKITLGGTDERATGPFVYSPIIEKSYYVIPAKGLQVAGGASLGLGRFAPVSAETRTILDSGTTLLRIPTSVADSVVRLMVQTVTEERIAGIPNDFWSTDRAGESYVANIAADDVAKFPVLELVLGGEDGSDFALRIEPDRYLKSVDEANPARRIFGIRAAPDSRLIVLGQVLFEGYTVVFDRAHDRIGFSDSTAICQ